nr:PQQ-dependent sugar dehydrogenase [Fibrobacterota bacterium]
MKILKTQVLVGAILLAGSATSIFAQLKYTGCADVTKADFKKVPLVTSSQHRIEEPIQMALAKDGRIFWIERTGMLRMWEPSKPDAAVTLISLPVFSENEFGASGIALDPGFEANKWIYAFWTVNTLNADGSRSFRVSRFTLANNALDMASQKTILEIPVTNFGCCHTAGSMIFDFAGNLFIAVGNTTNNGSGESQTPKINYVNQTDIHGDDQRGSSNTNSLLGKILRIKPKALSEGGASPAPGVGSTYDIPAGNLFPAGQYPAGKTRPEIYTMGHRNPYT